VRFLQFLSALVTAHLNRLSSNLDLDRIRIQLAVARSTSSSSHQISLHARNPGEAIRLRKERAALSESLALCRAATTSKEGTLSSLPTSTTRQGQPITRFVLLENSVACAL
jgi:hypothetical protein